MDSPGRISLSLLLLSCPMYCSLNWLNRYLSRPVDAQEADRILTAAGFPIEEETTLPDGNTLLDVEITSNRGDCLSHVGLAREVAAGSDRQLILPGFTDPAPGPTPVEKLLTLNNTVPDVCPLFTAQVITDVKVGPSPAWLVEALEAVGQRSINNVVDVTNFITFELGHPCHVFDRDKLAGHTLTIRYAHDKETLRTLDDKERVLRAGELVVADSERAQSLAGVIGGAESEVDANTTTVVLEMATWDPVTVRTAARRHAIRTDACHRFERIVDPREIDFAARRAVALLVELTGGQLAQGMLSQGKPFAPRTVVEMRTDRARTITGVDIADDEQAAMLKTLEIEVEQTKPGVLRCTIPPFRHDLTREIDLIEEVSRTRGFDAVPILPRMPIVVRPPQQSEQATRAIGTVLSGLGFYETITFTFTSKQLATPFLAPGMRLLKVDDARRKEEPYLRPSVLPSLLACRQLNQNSQVTQPGGVRLWECSAVFAEEDKPGRHSVEERRLTMLMDVPGSGRKRSFADIQHGLRLMRGAVQAIVRAVAGHSAKVCISPDKPVVKAYDTNAFASVTVDGTKIGFYGLVARSIQSQHHLDIPVIAAELDMDALVALYPPRNTIHQLPAFPSIERDLSFIVEESLPWARLEALVAKVDPDLLESVEFVTAFRGKPIEPGNKSMTMRLRFRASDRTLRHEEVDPQIEAIVNAAKTELGAELRA